MGAEMIQGDAEEDNEEDNADALGVNLAPKWAYKLLKEF
jgi:hypothetical protein